MQKAVVIIAEAAANDPDAPTLGDAMAILDQIESGEGGDFGGGAQMESHGGFDCRVNRMSFSVLAFRMM